MAYSLSTPFVSTFVFAAAMKQLQAPGTTFKRHLAIARGVLGEDNGLLREILWNPHTVQQVELIRDELASSARSLLKKTEKNWKPTSLACEITSDKAME